MLSESGVDGVFEAKAVDERAPILEDVKRRAVGRFVMVGKNIK